MRFCLQRAVVALPSKALDGCSVCVLTFRIVLLGQLACTHHIPMIKRQPTKEAPDARGTPGPPPERGHGERHIRLVG